MNALSENPDTTPPSITIPKVDSEISPDSGRENKWIKEGGKENTNRNLAKNLESKYIEARYKGVVSRLKSKFDVPNDLTGKVVKIQLNDSTQDKLISPKITLTSNGIRVIIGGSTYTFKEVGDYWITYSNGSSSLEMYESRSLEMYVSEICNNADKYKMEIEDENKDGRWND